MFILLISVIICGLFEWKRLCTGFFMFVYICIVVTETITVLRWGGMDPINQINHATCVCLSQDRT
jgi:hypothetical protein